MCFWALNNTCFNCCLTKKKRKKKKMVFSAATPYPSIMWCAHFIMSYNGEGFYWQAHMKWNGHTFSISGVNQYQRIQRWDEMRWWSKCREFKVYGVVMIIYSVSPHMVHDEMEWHYWRRGAVTIDLHRKWWRCQRSCQKSAWLTLGCSQTGICSSMTPQCLLFQYHQQTQTQISPKNSVRNQSWARIHLLPV